MDSHLGNRFQGRTGAYLLRQERAVLTEILPTAFGFYLVQAGAWGPAHDLLQSSPIRSQLMLDPQADGADLRADPAYLPLASDSVDAILLPHTLEYASDPYQVLREAERVLVGEGHLVVLGFHPWGAWGLRQRFFSSAYGRARSVRAGRLREWLSVLGFETVCLRHYLFRPPLMHKSLLVRSGFLDKWRWRVTAGAYMLVARKRVMCLTPLRRQRLRPQRAFAGVIKPSTREIV